jgi:hypothetical protein
MMRPVDFQRQDAHAYENGEPPRPGKWDGNETEYSDDPTNDKHRWAYQKTEAHLLQGLMALFDSSYFFRNCIAHGGHTEVEIFLLEVTRSSGMLVPEILPHPTNYQ